MRKVNKIIGADLRRRFKLRKKKFQEKCFVIFYFSFEFLILKKMKIISKDLKFFGFLTPASLTILRLLIF